METTKSGVIYSFRQENGFGILELEDGAEVLFDVTACVEEPLEGQPVRVVLGRGRRGEPRAVLVEPAGQPESTRPPRTLREAVKRLQSEGIALELDEYELGQLLERTRLRGTEPSELGGVLEEYYSDDLTGERRRSADQYVSVLPTADLGHFVRNLAETIGGDTVTFALPADSGLGVDDIVDAFNEELRAVGDPRRIMPLEMLDAVRGYFCMALARATRLASLGVLRVRWERPHLTPSEPPPRNA